jgi:hypothetical protein
MSAALSTESGFEFSSFGAVQVRPVKSWWAEISPALAADFANCVTYFSAQSNRTKLEVTFTEAGAAEKFADQIKTYADQHDLAYAADVEETTVRFRLVRHREPNANGEVTVTPVTPIRSAK